MASRPTDLEIARRAGARAAYPALYEASYADSQRAARANELARKIGIPADIVEADYPNMAAEERLRRAQGNARQNPVYGGMMSNPRFAAAAIDDSSIHPLANAVAQVREVAERATNIHAWPRNNDPKIKGWSAGPRAENLSYPMQILAAADRRWEGIGGGMGRALASISQMPSTRALLTRMASESEEYANWTPQESSMSSWQQVKRNPLRAPLFGVEQFISSSPDMLTLLGAFPLYIGARSGEIGQQRARNNGKADASLGDVLKAAPAATISAYLERLGLKGIGGAIRNPALRTVAMAATREAGTEFAQSGVEYVGSNLGTDAGWDGYEMLDQMVAGAVGGFFGGGIAGGAGGAVNLGMKRIYESRLSQDAAETVDQVMEAASGSATRTSNPGDFEEVLNQQLEGRPGETLYIPGEQVAALFQETDIADHAFWGQHAEQVAEAVALGGDVVIPLAAAATHLAGTPEWQALREHVRATPGGMSLAEARQRQSPEELEALATQLTDEIERRVPEIQAGRAVKKFAADMGYKGEQAKAITQLVAARLVVAAKLAGVAPAEMWERWRLSSEKTTQAAFDALGKTGALAQPLEIVGAIPKIGVVPANIGEDGRIYVGRPGEAHFQVMERYPQVRWTGGTGFLNSEGHFLNRTQALDWVNAGERKMRPSPNMRDELDALDYRDQVVARRDADAFNQPTRGNISLLRDEAGTMTGAVIRAFESANFSTAVHEMGHFWLEGLKTREDADWQTVQQWFAENGHDASETIPVEAHELWARGMERYIFEGKAPSKKLRSLFAKMRDWMKEIYRTVTSFRSPITPQVREVFDRMFATEEEIAAQRKEMNLAAGNMEGLLSEAEQAEYQSLTDDARQAAQEKLLQHVLSTLRRERTAEALARGREIRAEVEAEIDAVPVFAAFRLLRTGLPQEGGGTAKIRLSRQWLIDTYGEDILDQLPKWIQPLHSDSDTIAADELAEVSGFESGDQMVKALVSLEEQRQAMKLSGDKRNPRQAAIEETAKARLREEIGDPLENIEEEARAVLASERQADLMSMEMRALARKTGQRVTPWKMAREWAEGHIAASKVRDSVSGSALQMYARNAGKAGGNAEQALIKGDFEEAFRFKQQQMLNLALLSEAKKAKDGAEKAVGRLQKIASKKTIVSVDQDYLDQAHLLLEGVEMKTRPLSQVDKRQAFEAWYANQIAEGREPIVPPEYQRTLGQTNWQQLTIAELSELDGAIGQIMRLGRLKQKLLDGKESRDKQEVIAGLVGSAENQRQRKQSAANDPSRILGERVKSRIRAADAMMIKMETIVDWLDGGDPNGPWNRAFMWVASNAQGRQADLTREYSEAINDIIKAVPRAQARRWGNWVDTPELVNNIPDHPQRGEVMRFKMDQIVMMAMNWGNEGNRQRLLDGFGWDKAAAQAVLDRLMTKADWQFVRGVWETVGRLWPEVQEMERRVNGYVPPKVEGIDVVTPFGTFKGDYFPAVYDTLYSNTAAQQEADKMAPGGGALRVTVRASSVNDRAAAVKGRPLLLNMGVVTQHMGEVIHYITHREAVAQMNTLLKSSKVRNAVKNALGPEYLKTMEAVVSNMAQPNLADSKSWPFLVAVARHLNKGVSVVGLGFRVSTILQQPLGLLNMAGVVGERAVAEGMAISIAHPVETYREVTTRSAEMRHRFSNMDATIQEMWETHAATLKAMGPARIERAAFKGIAFFDALITTGGWIGAFNKGLREGQSEEEATHYADKVIRTSQGAGGTKDKSVIQLEHAFVRPFVPFFSYLNANYNQRRTVWHNLRGGGSPAAAARAYWWVAIAPSLAMALLFGNGPDDDESWAEYLAKSVALGGLAPIPGVGNFANALGNDYGYRITPWQQVGEGVGKTWEDAQAAFDEEDDASASWIKNAFNTVGVLTAKPLGQPGTTAQGLYDYAEGNAEPENVGDWYELLTKGRISEPSE